MKNQIIIQEEDWANSIYRTIEWEQSVEIIKWEYDFARELREKKNETWIIDKREFQITLKQGEDIEIEFMWDYGYGGRGTERMTIPVQVLKDLISELGM